MLSAAMTATVFSQFGIAGRANRGGLVESRTRRRRWKRHAGRRGAVVTCQAERFTVPRPKTAGVGVGQERRLINLVRIMAVSALRV